MPRKPKNQIKDINQIHGQLPQEKPKPWNGARSIDEVLGRRAHSIYTQGSEEEYRDYLNSLDFSEQREEAMRIGMVPSPDPLTLKRNLIERFLEARAFFIPMTVKKSNDRNVLPTELRNRMGNDY